MRTNTKIMCYNIAQLLAHVLANKPFTFFQTTYIKTVLLYKVCEYIILFNLCRIENIRIYSVFFSSGRERLDAVDSASTYGASTIKNRFLENAQSKKVPYEIGVLL